MEQKQKIIRGFPIAYDHCKVASLLHLVHIINYANIGKTKCEKCKEGKKTFQIIFCVVRI